MTRISKTLLPLLSLALALTACEGPTGPEGPAGPQGAQGAAGERGPEGPQGLSGGSNMAMFSFTLAEDDFTDNEGIELAAYAAPLITADVVENGVVLAYSDLGSDRDFWVPLPVFLGTLSQTFTYAEGSLGILISRPNAAPPQASVFAGDQIRVVTFSSAGAQKLDGVDTEDYEAVMELFDAEVNAIR